MALAPVILGEAAWGLLRKEPFRDWEGFQRIVEDNFGLSQQWQSRQVSLLARQEGEGDLDFILRSEQVRMTLTASVEVVMAKVWPDLSEDIREKLDDEAERMGLDQLTWPMVVQWARKRQQRSINKCMESKVNEPGGTLKMQLAPQVITPAGDTFQAPAPPAPRAANRAAAPKQSQAYGENKAGTCWICQDFGCPTSQHTADQCFANPKSKLFRAATRNYRLKELEKMGRKPSARYL